MVDFGQDGDARKASRELLGAQGFGKRVGLGLGAVENDAGDPEGAEIRGLDGEKGVVQGAEASTGDDEQGKVESDGEVGESGPLGERAEKPANAFDDDHIDALGPPCEGFVRDCLDMGLRERLASATGREGGSERVGVEERDDSFERGGIF